MPQNFFQGNMSSSSSVVPSEVGLNPNYCLIVVPSRVLKWGPPMGAEPPKSFIWPPIPIHFGPWGLYLQALEKKQPAPEDLKLGFDKGLTEDFAN